MDYLNDEGNKHTFITVCGPFNVSSVFMLLSLWFDLCIPTKFVLMLLNCQSFSNFPSKNNCLNYFYRESSLISVCISVFAKTKPKRDLMFDAESNLFFYRKLIWVITIINFYLFTEFWMVIESNKKYYSDCSLFNCLYLSHSMAYSG